MSVYESLSETQKFACRVIADHARATAFSIADGILPGNEGRNYVLRKIMRRAIYHGREHLGLTEPFFYKVCDFVVVQMKDAYPELAAQRDFVEKMARLEEERFGNTMTVGLAKLNELFSAMSVADKDRVFLSAAKSGEFYMELARLYDTFGTPRDLIRVKLEEFAGIPITEEEFNEKFDIALTAIQQQSGIGETHRKSEISPIYAKVLERSGAAMFLGYETTRIEQAKVIAIIKGDLLADALNSGDEGLIVLNDTPFYAESGGQVGDTGMLLGSGDDGGTNPEFSDSVENTAAAGFDLRVRVIDTFAPFAGLILHKARVERGEVRIGDRVTAIVDDLKRDATRRNHTATHLLHAALKEILGSHVKQAGSVVAPNYLRFDFTHYQPISCSEIEEIEDLVNSHILRNEPVTTDEMAIEDAMRSGAIAMFGEKYGSRVRVLSVGDGSFSKELCGGTHVRATGDIGAFKITSDEAIASGVRRIRAITGFDAFARFREDEKLIDRSLAALKTQRDNLPSAIEKIQDELKRTRREVEELRLKIATNSGSAGGDDEAREIGGVKVLAKIVEGLDAGGGRQLSDTLLARLKQGVVILGRLEDGKASIIVRVSADLTDRIRAGNIIKEIAPIVGGRGGGRPDMAEGGGPDAENLPRAIEAGVGVIEKMLG